jgi:hypothetical protein
MIGLERVVLVEGVERYRLARYITMAIAIKPPTPPAIAPTKGKLTDGASDGVPDDCGTT